MAPEDAPEYVTGARPLTAQEAAFRRWLEDGATVRLAERAKTWAPLEMLLQVAEEAFAAGWSARGGEDLPSSS